MLRYTNYLDDIQYTVQVYRMILRLIGVWPMPENASLLAKIFRKILVVTCFFLLAFLVVPRVLFAIYKLENFKTRVKIGGNICFYSMALIVYCSLILRENQIRKCVKEVEEDWMNLKSRIDRSIMLGRARMGRYIMITAITFFYSSGFLFRIVLPLSRGKVTVNGNVTIRPLVHSDYFIFFNPYQTPTFEIVFCVQTLSAIILYTVTASVCGLTTFFVMHICGQMEILVNWLEEIADERNMEKSRAIDRKYAIIVSHHVKIRRFLNKVQVVLREMCFIEVIGCTFIMCLLEYYLIMEWEQSDRVALITYTVLFISFSFNIFMLCYIGEVLIEQGTKIHTTSCTVNWYSMPFDKARNLVLIIAMSSYPTKMTAGHFIDLSLSNFGAVFKTSMGYLNLLRKVTL